MKSFRFLIGLVTVSCLGISASSQIFSQGKIGSKKPLPEAKAQAKALELIQFEHREKYQQAKSSKKAKSALAIILMDQADDFRKNLPGRFVRLQEAYRLAADGGDNLTAFSAVEELGKSFAVNTQKLTIEVFNRVIQATQSTEENKILVDVILNKIASALEKENYPHALALGKVAEKAARKSKYLPLVLTVQRERRNIQETKNKVADLEPFLKRLREKPEDPKANLVVGRYKCLHKGNWDEGLFLLAQSDHPQLRLLAQRDLIQPDDPEEQKDVGNGWWDYAEKEEGLARTAFRQRAVYWYEQAVYGLDAELRQKLEKRIASVPRSMRFGIPWDYSGKPGLIRQVVRESGNIYGVAFSPDGRKIVSGGSNNFAKIWDAKSAKLLHQLNGHTSYIWSIAYGPRNRFVYTASWDGSVRKWDARSGKFLVRYPKNNRIGNVYALAISRDGKKMLTGGNDGLIRLWDLQTGKETKQLRGHSGVVYAVTFSPDGRKALSGGGSDRNLIYWDLATGKAIRKIHLSSSIRNVAITPDGRRGIGSGEREPQLWDLKTGKVVRKFTGHTGTVYALDISPDGRRMITGSSDDSLRYWDLQSGRELQRFNGHTGNVYAVAFSPGGGRVVSGSSDNTVRLWGMPRR